MGKVTKDMNEYYKERASDYEAVYHFPERQSDLRFLEQFVANNFADKRVLELAAGTGYWTEHIAKSADLQFSLLTIQFHNVNACQLLIRIARGILINKDHLKMVTPIKFSKTSLPL